MSSFSQQVEASWVHSSAGLHSEVEKTSLRCSPPGLGEPGPCPGNPPCLLRMQARLWLRRAGSLAVLEVRRTRSPCSQCPGALCVFRLVHASSGLQVRRNIATAVSVSVPASPARPSHAGLRFQGAAGYSSRPDGCPGSTIRSGWLSVGAGEPLAPRECRCITPEVPVVPPEHLALLNA